MILVGSKRGGGADLARHLMKPENDHVELHEMRGFISEDLLGAFKETRAISRGTRARQYLFSLSLNPPKGEKVSTKGFEDAINRAEVRLGLSDQPRAVVFHIKDGRRHAHVAWSRISLGGMKAIPMPHFKRKLNTLAKELFLEHGWMLPDGFRGPGQALATNFTLAEWQQAKRAKKDPRAIKDAFREAWNISETQNAFAGALKERGYILARGDRRGFVGVDYRGEVYAVPKWTGLRAKEVRGKLTDMERVPSVDEAKAAQATALAERLEVLRSQHNGALEARFEVLTAQRKSLKASQSKALNEFERNQEARAAEETLARQAKFSKGIRGLFDWMSGRRRRIATENEAEALKAAKRDRGERDTLTFVHVEELHRLQSRVERLKSFSETRGPVLDLEVERLHSGQLPETLKTQTPSVPMKEPEVRGLRRVR